jgi:AraC-like DNA-binding protein
MQTLLKNHLTLQLVRLNPAQEWKDSGEALSFVLLKGGKGKYALRKNAWNLQPGDLVVLNPTAGGTLSGQNGELTFWRFSVCIEHLLPLFSAEEICLLQNITENFRESKYYSASSAVAQTCHALVDNAPPQGNVDHRSQMLRIAAAVLSVEFLNARSHRNGFVRAEDHMIQVFESLSAEELLTLSVGDLADKFGCSRRHLNRLFHQHFGFSVATLRMEMRLLKAISLLRDPHTKVIGVAEQCGFNHLGLFNTCFKRRFGNSPGQWRKTAGQGSGETAFAPQGLPTKQKSLKSMDSIPTSPDLANPMKAKVFEILRKVYPDESTSAPNMESAGDPELAVVTSRKRVSERNVRCSA